MNKKPSEKMILNDVEFLQKEFYRTYDPDYWLYKINLLWNCHENYEQVKNILIEGMSEIIDEDYKRMIRTEMHFLYFQMIETLFEIIFAILEYDNRDLWISLTFSSWADNYKKIEKLSNHSLLFTKRIKTTIGFEKTEISLLRWIFYFIYPFKMTGEEWRKNLEKIKNLLLLFAKDFSDRGEYNAYKHSLRFYNSSFSMAIKANGSKKMHGIGSSRDSITFLEKKKRIFNGNKINQIMRTIKPFDFERDYNCCLIIYQLIKNIIKARKHSLLDNLKGKKIKFFIFKDVDIPKVIIPKTGVFKSSFTA